ncbi:glycosyltransferase family 2 protein [Rothia sp. (in: high G+C Gram-positive bacteria)]|uniref:glycosyltransferase family 2 protein n=1 Tax=Rothia sp. (in: high G+C Gram-positive bacteria) TaxID=1885016 RepID=UPI00321693E6
MNTNMTSWTLVTVTYNSAEVLPRFWSRFDPTSSLRWIVVDNNSSDNSVEVARSLGADVIESSTNLGFGGANNLGFAASTSEYVAFVNPDVAVDYGSLDGLAQIINETQGLVSPQLINSDGSLQPNGRGWPVMAHKVLNRLAPQRVDGKYRIFANPGEMAQVPWFIGAVVASTRENFLKLGPWDEHFFVYYEDTDLCLRARKQGINSYVVGDHQWTHGWARATAKFNKNFFRSWKLELDSLSKFYMRYPLLLVKEPAGEQPYEIISTDKLEYTK